MHAYQWSFPIVYCNTFRVSFRVRFWVNFRVILGLVLGLHVGLGLGSVLYFSVKYTIGNDCWHAWALP